MGRPGCPARKHFVRWGTRKVNASHYPYRCKHCVSVHYLQAAARRLAGSTAPSPPWSPSITRRQPNFNNHLRNVHGVTDPRSVPAPPTPSEHGPFEGYLPRVGSPCHDDRRLQPPPRQEHCHLDHPPFNSPQPTHLEGGTNHVQYSPDQRSKFERLLLEFQVCMALPDSFVEDATTIRLFCFLNPGCLAYIPSRRVLGGRILNGCADELVEKKSTELRKYQEDTGGRVNLLSDVWQNISRTHLLGAHLSLFGLSVVEGLHSVGSDHHGLAVARQLETLMNTLISNGWNVGSCITDDAGQCSRARRVLAIRWPHIYFGKCFAHDINNLVKAILTRTGFRVIANQACAAVNAINGSSSKWLPRANAIIMETYDLVKPLAFLTLCYTRWNSMQACFASLLRVKTGLKQFATRYQYDTEVPSHVKVFLDEVFWNTLADAERTIRPLCNASYTLQRDENTLVDVVMMYRDIFDSFSGGPHATELIPLVEEQWADCEQPLFILALFLHPGYVNEAKALPSGHISSINAVCTFAVYYFKRFFPKRNPGMLRHHVFQWCRSSLYLGELDYISYDEFPTAQAFWSYAKGKSPGPNLPDLALAVLAIAANTATCERRFSALGRIHTRTRNCLKPDKVNKAAIISQAVWKRDREASKLNRRSGDEEVLEEDDEGNKLVDRIVKAAERSFKGDSWLHAAPRRPVGLSTEADVGLTAMSTDNSTIHQPVSSCTPESSCVQFTTPSVARSTQRSQSNQSHPSARRRSTEPRVRRVASHYRSLTFDLDQCSNDSHSRSNTELPVDRTLSQQYRTSIDYDDTTTDADDILSHWCVIFSQMADVPPTSSDDFDMHEEEEELDVRYDESQLRLVPIPEGNDPHFPQESRKLPGIRGRKMPLVELFSMPSTL